MGQHSSTAFQKSSQPLFPRRRSKAPPTPAMTPREEVSAPTTPSYAVAENKVLPNGAHDMNISRKHLRPVSQDLTKFHPEYAELFPAKQAEDICSIDKSLDVSANGKWNSDQSLDKISHSKQITRISNGTNHARKASISNGNDDRLYKNEIIPSVLESDHGNLSKGDYSISNPDVHLTLIPATNIARSQSMGLEIPVNIPKHKRHTSLASGSSLQDTVIVEDPREHLYNAARNMPFSNYQPSTTSLPLKNTFDIDYSLNLTYAQLSEFRRNKRTTELERRTGRRLEELEAELSASSTLPKSPFDLQNLGGKSSTQSISTKSFSTDSSDTGMSKSKKKQAPEPPKLQSSNRQRNLELVTSEAKSGFDMKSKSLVSQHNREKSLQRSISSASKSSKPPAPQPLPNRMSSVSLQESTSVVTQLASVPYTNNLSMSASTLPRSSSNKGQSDAASKVKTPFVPGISVQQSISQAKEQLDALKKLQDFLSREEPPITESSENKITNAPIDIEDDAFTEIMNLVDLESVRDDNGNMLDKDSSLDTLNQTEVHRTEMHMQKAHQPEAYLTEVPQSKVPELEVQRTEIHQLDAHETEQNNSHIIETQCQTIPEKHIKEFTVSSDEETPLKMMSSVLQQDIIIAAQVRRTKNSKRESPTLAEYSENTPRVITEILLKDEIANAEDNTNIEKFKEGERNADNVYTSKSHDNKTTIFQNDDFSVIKKTMRSDSESSSTCVIQNENEIIKTEGIKPLGPLWKHEIRMPQSRDELDQEDMSSAASVDISIRSSIQSEDMSISSSNTSQRVYSSDWAPEQDLDPDDDIMNDSYIETGRRVSTEGFKPSILPHQISSLKESKTNRGSKKSKRNERKEAGFLPANEKSKFGSIRKFQKSVHQSMKNAFGSISKASGALLNKQKSQDFLDGKEQKSQNFLDGKEQQSQDFFDSKNQISHTAIRHSDDNALQSFRNLNWALSSSGSGSLRRAVSDGVVNQSHLDRDNESEILDYSDNEIGDIDFAEGLNDTPIQQKSSNQIYAGGQASKVVKRPGVAYVSGKGQIVVLPEYHTVHVDDNGRIVSDSPENEGHAPKTYKKKENKYTYQSTLRKQEKYRIEEALERMISEKEEQYEIERLRQKEIESNFRRLRNLEIQERKQRLQKDNIQEHIAKLQNEQLVMQAQNELNNNALSLPPLNNMGVVTTGPVMNTSYMSSDVLPVSSPYSVNSHPLALNLDYLNSSMNFGNTVPVVPQLPYSLPFSPTSSSLVQPLSQSVMPNIFTNAVNFPHYPASTVGGGPVSGIYSNMVNPNLTPQELAYLSDYMWKIGVPPPATPQQWSALLNSIAYSSPDFPLFGQTQVGIKSGPDLSHIFQNQKHTNMDAPIIGSNQQSFQSPRNTSVQQQHDEDVTNKPLTHQNSLREQLLNQPPPQLASTRYRKIDFAVVKNTRSLQPTQEPSSATYPTTSITRAVDVSATNHHNKTSEEKTNNLASINVDKQMVNSQNLPSDDKPYTQNSARAQPLPAKVYGPIGFRPVSFHVGSSR